MEFNKLIFCALCFFICACSAVSVGDKRITSRDIFFADLLAGSLAGSIVTFIFYPLEFLETKMQVSKQSSKSKLSLIQLAKKTLAVEGVKSFYQGVVPSLLGNFINWGLYFGIYQFAKEWWRSTSVNQQQAESIFGQLFAGVLAGIICTIVVNPLWVLKVRLATSKKYLGLLDAFFSILRTEGISGLFKGVGISLIGVSEGTIQFTSYEQIKLIIGAHYGVAGQLFAGGLARGIAGVITFPYILLRTTLQAPNTPYKGLSDACEKIYHTEGLTGFYKGIMPNLIRNIPPAAFMMFLVEILRNIILTIITQTTTSNNAPQMNTRRKTTTTGRKEWTRMSRFFALFCFLSLIHNVNAQTAIEEGFFNNGVRLCGLQADGTCDWSEYITGLAYIAIGGILIAGISFIVPIATFFARLCDGCGGKYPSYELCCGGDDGREYSKKEVWGAKIAAWILIIPIVISVGLALNANSSFSDNVHEIGDSLYDSTTNIVNQLVLVKEIVLNASIPLDNVTTPLDKAVSVAYNIQNSLNNGRNEANKYDGDRDDLTSAAVIVTLTVVVAALLASIFNVRILSYIAGLISFWVCALMWLSFSIHLSAGKLTYDICAEITTLQQEPASPSLVKTGPLAAIWGCDSNSGFLSLQSYLLDAEGYIMNNTCSTYAILCNYGEFNCTTASCNIDNEAYYYGVTFAFDAPVGCQPASGPPICPYNENSQNCSGSEITCPTQYLSIPQCSYACTDNTFKEGTTIIVQNHNWLSALLNAQNNALTPVLDCSLALSTLSSIQPFLCGQFINSIFELMIYSWIAGIFLIGLSFTLIVGKKRFVRLRWII